MHIVLPSTLDIGGVESNDGEAEDKEEEVDDGKGEIALGDAEAFHDGRRGGGSKMVNTIKRVWWLLLGDAVCDGSPTINGNKRQRLSDQGRLRDAERRRKI